ncbi:MAG: flagellar motor stator protein MotA [Alphaproteobacteria bacterium]
MFIIIGSVVVLACVLGGYLALGGHIELLIQPFELVIIGGAALGAFISANPKSVVITAFKSFGTLLRGSRYTKASYLELLSLLFTIFKLVKSKGALVIEQHVENPHESDIFKRFPTFAHDHHSLTFLCDYLRIMTLGTDNPHQMEELIEAEIDTHHQELNQVSRAVQNVADGLPALGIVAAVLGVIKTMGAITEPPEILGGLIGAALVGTFLGVLLAYGFVGPTATALKGIHEAETKYLQCIKAGLLAHLQGCAPAVAVEFARKSLLSTVRPTFYEVEAACAEVPAA